MKLTGIVLTILIGVVPIAAANYELLTDLGASADTIAIGNVEGFNGSAAAVFENPAALYAVDNTSVGLFMTTLLNEVYYKNMSIAGRTPLGVFGVGYMEATVFDIPYTGENTITREFYVKDYFDYKDSLLKFSYQADLAPNWSMGLSYVHYSRNILDIKASGGNFDLGAIYTQPNYQLSVFVRNIIPNTHVTFTFADGDSAYEVIPTEIVTSGRYKVMDGGTVYGQLKSRNSQNLASLGVSYSPREFANFEVSAGYRQYLVLDQIKGGLSLGVGVDLMGIRANYAYEKVEDHPQFDNKSYFSVSINL